MNHAATGNGVSEMPSKADEIRANALEQHVRPWRRSREKRLAIRAGNIVRGLRLRNATPNVCSALASRKFQHEAAIVLVHREGPRQSTTTTFLYEADPATPSPPPHRETNSTLRSSYRQPPVDRPAPERDEEWRTADLCLVSCVSVKRPGACAGQGSVCVPLVPKGPLLRRSHRVPMVHSFREVRPRRSEFDDRSLQPNAEDHAGEPPTSVGERRDRGSRSAFGRCQLRRLPCRKRITANSLHRNCASVGSRSTCRWRECVLASSCHG